MIWAMIVDLMNVPANVKIATTTIANPCFLNVSTSFPMEIPAYARIGVQSGRSPICIIYELINKVSPKNLPAIAYIAINEI